MAEGWYAMQVLWIILAIVVGVPLGVYLTRWQFNNVRRTGRGETATGRLWYRVWPAKPPGRNDLE
jgi:hypothetical protein